ncbi:MAG: hypothetical protein P1U56_17355 [Saprospiraceae bacterium]|nr:hypothetical protein [Saprospiraceae bacterium]
MKSPTYLTLIGSLLFTLFSLEAIGQISNSSIPSNHDFDFWIGNWDVYKFGTDTLVGQSEIKPILNHSAIEENYKGWQNPFKGTSNNIFNTRTQKWEQHWIDNTGFVLHISGGLSDGKMKLIDCIAQNCNKIIWSPLSDESVRQEWFVSSDTGTSWNKIFDGHYKQKWIGSDVQPVLSHLNEYPNIRDFTINTTGEEAYITVQNPTEEIRTICRIDYSNGVWSDPTPTSFSGYYKDIEPYLSPDNLRLYFASNRPNAFEKENYDIYYVERSHPDSVWSTPKNIGNPINTEFNEFYPAISRSGNLYFTSVKPKDKGKDNIYCSVLKNSIYSPPFALDTTINTTGYEFNSYIAPDESFIIFSGYNRGDGHGSGDLYISFREEGQWSKSKNLGNLLNSRYMEYCPFVDHKNGFLYFTSRRHSEVSNAITTNSQLENEVLKYTNGSSRIYRIRLQSINL